MQRCIQLAANAAGDTAPNPMVGAVLVYNDRIIGEGFHKLYGQAHAEVNCIMHAEKHHSDLVSQSSLYVSLEPCAHFGKTPPCADLIIHKKIPKVFIGCSDPFGQVNGKGIEKLRAANIVVEVGILEAACRELNKRFFTFHQQKRPYIILKWAASADGKIAGIADNRVFISNALTNRLVHKWRSEEAAIMVGTNTALKDDPSLTTRLWVGKNPVRVIIDMNLRLPAILKVFDDSVKTVIFNTAINDEKANTRWVKLEKQQPLPEAVAHALYQLNIQSVLIEGGSRLIQSFIQSGYWDEARVITNNHLHIGAGVDAPALDQAFLVDIIQSGSDTIRVYRSPLTKNV